MESHGLVLRKGSFPQTPCPRSRCFSISRPGEPRADLTKGFFMNASLLKICDQIKATDGHARAKHVQALLTQAESLGDSLSLEDANGIAAALSPIGELNAVNAKLRTERNQEKVRALMMEAMKLRNQMKPAVKQN